MTTKHQEKMAEQEEISSVDKNWDDPDMLWIPPAFLKRMKANGFHVAWIRFTEGDDKVDRRLAQRLHQGWEFVRPDMIPEWRFPPTIEHTKLSNLVAVGDLALAVVPQDVFDRYKGLEVQRAADQARAVRNNLMNQSDRRMPISDNTKTVTTQGGRPTKFGD